MAQTEASPDTAPHTASMAQTQGLPDAALWHSLPAEMEDMVWKHVFTLDYQIRAPHREFRPDHKTSAQLLRLNKTFYSRYYPTFWSCNLFRVEPQFRSYSDPATLWQPSAPFSDCIQTISMSYSVLKKAFRSLSSFSGLKTVYIDEFHLDNSDLEAEEILGTRTIKNNYNRRYVSSGLIKKVVKRNPEVEVALVVTRNGESDIVSVWCYIAGLDARGQLEFRKVSDFDTRARSY